MGNNRDQSPQDGREGASRQEISPGSSAGLAFFNGYMPPVAIHLKDGTVVHCKYGELDQVVKGLKATHKEREGHA